ncbi:diphthine--ammonia ligase [Cuniculiplasmataceae archaeon SKW2]
MKGICLMSGGKDSFLSAVIAMEQGIELINAITVIPEKYSEMFHFPNIRMAEDVSKLLGLNTIFLEEKNFNHDLSEIIRTNDVKVLVSGAIASNFQKTRLEKLCTDNKIIHFTPLWLLNQEKELKMIVESRIHPIIVSVSSEGLDGSFLGMEIDMKGIEKLMKISSLYGMNPSGEGGEYETLVLSYLRKSISFRSFKDYFEGNNCFRIFEK